MTPYSTSNCPPILLIIFNRPDLSTQVLNRIREVHPRQLFIAGDAPRREFPTDINLCKLSRNLVSQVDWECNILTLFQKTNLGCKKGPEAAINWFFENVDEGIILEEDCLPDITFFNYCAELLEYYRYKEEVMMIGGNNYQFGRKRTPYSYYFSVFGHIWGWATWRRAWIHDDARLITWPEVRGTNWIKQFMLTEEGAKKYTQNLDSVFNGELETWDYVWSYSRWRQNGLSIVPEHNLVTNIGIDNRGIHTKKKNRITTLVSEAMPFPIKHPPFIVRNVKANKFTVNHLYLRYPLPEDVGWHKYTYMRIRNKLPLWMRRRIDPLLKPK